MQRQLALAPGAVKQWPLEDAYAALFLHPGPADHERMALMGAQAQQFLSSIDIEIEAGL
jgi:hypothetical protein